MRPRHILSIAAVITTFWSSLAIATDADPQVKTNGGISYVSGGVGEEEMTAIRALEKNFDVRLVFAYAGTGEYLADIPVTIADDKGKQVFNVTSEGPYLLLKLPPGRYRITAIHGNQPISKTVQVAAQGIQKQSFLWPAGADR